MDALPANAKQALVELRARLAEKRPGDYMSKPVVAAALSAATGAIQNLHTRALYLSRSGAIADESDWGNFCEDVKMVPASIDWSRPVNECFDAVAAKLNGMCMVVQ